MVWKKLKLWLGITNLLYYKLVLVDAQYDLKQLICLLKSVSKEVLLIETDNKVFGAIKFIRAINKVFTNL